MRRAASGNALMRYRPVSSGLRAGISRCFGRIRPIRRSSSSLFALGVFRSVRVGLDYRALGVAVPEGVQWFWIGSHAEYDRLIG